MAGPGRRGNVAVPTSAALCRYEKLHIALGAGDRALSDTDHVPAGAFEPLPHFAAHALMQRRVTDDPALPDFLAPDLELRLDQRHQRAARLGADERHLEHFGKADEGSIAH